MEILDLDHDKNLKFSSYTHFTYINTKFEYCHACVISEMLVTFVFLFL